MKKGGGGKMLIHKMWIKVCFFLNSVQKLCYIASQGGIGKISNIGIIKKLDLGKGLQGAEV